MSKELLTRALQRLYLDNPNPPPGVARLCKEIEAELAKPDPEPVAYCTTDVLPNDHPMSVKQYPKISLIRNDRYCIPVYTTHPTNMLYEGFRADNLTHGITE